jgi:ATP-dependent helicase HepA
MRFAAGQRWISEPEPELGLGIVLDFESGRVKMFFPASNGMRLYAGASAPLRRVRFKVGDTVAHEGESFVVQIVNERSDGVLTYGGPKGERLVETQLSDTLTFDQPGDRIAAAQVDDSSLFELRLRALEHQHRVLQSPVYGFAGARIDLIPHQLAIAQEVANRHGPRVLLADEVGLGKTIEACLILHRLHLAGKAARVLILLPEALVHQWFVELLRRFNMLFAIFDEERCAAIEANNEGVNPFLDDQLLIAPIGWPAHNETRRRQMVLAGWDLLIVDEAHHLTWSPEAASPEYTLVEALSQKVPSLLLLTATPQQLGPEGHFARLRLLDPDRYPSLEAFQQETEQYAPVAQIADKLLAKKKLTVKDVARLTAMPGRISHHVEALQGGDVSAREPLLAELLDQRGTGRVMFRNTRAALTGFPKRIAKLIPLEGAPELALAEFRGESTEFAADPRIDWLVTFLKKLKGAKALLICATREKAEAVETALRSKLNVATAVFHEGLTLLQRDRNAAHFADEDGAQVLICSEIGSEGRNFQFAHHLALFDLPENPELLEQRIGRLDRIGQSSDIHIHVPYIEEGPYEVLARWYAEGLNAFEESLHGGGELFSRFAEQVRTLALSCLEKPPAKGRKKAATNKAGIDALITETQKVRQEIQTKLAAGQDRLLELNNGSATGSAKVEALIDAICASDSDTTLDEFMLEIFDVFGVQVEDIGLRTWIVTPGAGGESFPGIPADGITLTADRSRALAREDVAYLTWDHPAVRGAFELVLGGMKGNAAVGVSSALGSDQIVLEAVHVLEVIAPAELHAERFLPSTPLLVMVDARFNDWDRPLSPVENGPVSRVLGKADLCYKLLPRLLEHAQKLAEARANELVAVKLRAMLAELSGEIDRLRDLQAVNPNVRQIEI